MEGQGLPIEDPLGTAADRASTAGATSKEPPSQQVPLWQLLRLWAGDHLEAPAVDSRRVDALATPARAGGPEHQEQGRGRGATAPEGGGRREEKGGKGGGGGGGFFADLRKAFPWFREWEVFRRGRFLCKNPLRAPQPA